MATLKSTGLAALVAALMVLLMGVAGADAQAVKHPTGAVASPPDVIAKLPHTPEYRDVLPVAVDLSRYMPPVGDQGQQGSCVGWSTAYAARAYYAEQVEHRDTTLKQNQPSPAWVFDIIHMGNDCLQGSQVPDAMAVLQQGAYSLADFPYTDQSCARPAPEQRSKPTDFKIAGFEVVYDIQGDQDLDKVKGALAKGHPVVVVSSVDDSFQNLTPKNKIWKNTSDLAGDGHAFTIVGYDDRTQVFKFINSWGLMWGDQGYGWLTYDTFHHRIIQGYIEKMPGDPDITLTEADLNPDPIVVTPPGPGPGPQPPFTPGPGPKFVPPLNVRPDSRSLGGADEPVDVGQISCGAVNVVTDDKGNRTAVGFVGTQDELDRVNEALKGKVETNEVTLAPWPECELRVTLAAPLADTDTPLAVVDPQSPKVGDAVRLGIQSPGFASYVYAAYVAADGSVTSLLQPGADSLKAKAAHSVVTFGNTDAGETGLTISKPVGNEMLVVLASEKPLFDAALPGTLTDRAFLSDLRLALLAGDAGRVTATVVPVTTTE